MSLNQFQFAEAYTEISMRDKQFHQAMGRITGSLTKLKASLDVAARHAQRFLLIGAGALAAFIKVAADAEEGASKFNAVFKDGAGGVRAWADDLAKAVGRSRQEIENTLSAFQAFFVGMGFGAGQAEEMSKKMQALAIDFASFHNLSDAEASQRFISALSGSSEVLDMFGINIKQAALEQELLSMGITKSVAKATEQEKALARLNVIFKAMGQQGAVGDALRTQDSMANQFKRLVANVKELAVELGNTFMPIAKDLVTWLVEIAKVSKDWVLGNKDLIITLTKYGAVGLAAIVVSAKLAGGLVAIAAASKLAYASITFLLGASGPAGWAAIATGVTVATAAVLAMSVAYDKLAESAGKAVDAAKEAAEGARKGGVTGAGGTLRPTSRRADIDAVVAAEGEVAKAKAKAVESEERIEDNRAKAQAERDKNLARMRKNMRALPGPREKIETPLGDINLGVGTLFGKSDEERLAAIDAARKAMAAESRKPLPGVPSAEAHETIRWRNQRDIDRAQARADTARAAEVRSRRLPWTISDQMDREREASERAGEGEPVPGTPQFDPNPQVVKEQQALQAILRDRGSMRDRPRTEMGMMGMAAVQGFLQQRFNQPSRAEQDAARQRDTLITATQDVSKTIAQLNLGWQ